VKLARETARPAIDRLSTFIAAGAWASIVGGAALVISFLLEWLVVPYEKLGAAAADLTASYLTASSLRLLSTVLFLWVLLALYNRQSIAAGTFCLWGFIVAFFGTALLVGNVWAEVFVWPTLARIAPNLVTGQVAAPHLTTGITLSAPLFGIGIVLFGLATLKSRCLSAMGGRIVDRLNSGHHVSSSYGRNLLRIDRADHGRLCLHDSRLARPESCTHQILSKPEHRCSHIADIALCRIPRYSDQAARRPTSRQPHGGVTTIGRDRTVSPSCRPAVGENLLYAFKAPGKVGRTHSSGESAPLRAARCPAGGVTTSGAPRSPAHQLWQTPGAIARGRGYGERQPVRPSGNWPPHWKPS
jgi:hypothetical protein